MKFAAFIQYAWLVWLVPGLLLLFVLTGLKRRRLTAQFISKEYWKGMIPGLGRTNRKFKSAFVLLSLGLLVIAAFRPQWGFELREVNRKGVDIYVLVDTSDSMQAQDLKPSRMERAKRELKDLLQWLTGDRIGLIPFAGKSTISCPLTTDYATFDLFLDQLDTDLIPIQGTDLAGALQKALTTFEPSQSRSKAILLLTDGEATQGSLDPLIEQVKAAGIKIFVMGFGTEEGAPIPAREGGGFKKDETGAMVISKLKEGSLKELASETGGVYVRSVASDKDLEAVYLKGIKGLMTDQELKGEKKQIPHERFQVPLALGLLLLLIEALIAESRSPKKEDA